MIGFFLYIVIMIPTICIIMFWLGEYIVSKISPMSKFARFWRAYICDIDPDER
jgi:hypothetical protein